MSVENAVDRESGRLVRRLLALYSRWLIWYLLGVIFLWILGLEAIYAHPTPFYALYDPVFSSLFVPAVVTILVTLMGLAILRFSFGQASAHARWVAISLFGCGLLVVVATYALHGEASLHSRSLADELRVQWALLRWHLLPLLVFASSCVLWRLVTRRAIAIEREPTARATVWMLVGIVLFSMAFSASLAMIREGARGISGAYERQTYEYIGDIGRGLSIRGLFHDYIKMHPYLSMHAKVHPPGPIVILWLLADFVAGREPLSLSMATIVFGALAILPLYLWARELAGPRVALTCCAIYALAPSIVLFTATSTDILFMPFTLTTLLLFWRAIHRRSVLYAVYAGVFFAVVSLLSFSLLGLGVFFALVGVWRLRDKTLRFSVMQTAVVMALSFLALHAAVRWWSGFDVIECFRVCKAQFETDQVNLDQVTPRFPAWTWKVLNPFCWAFFAGIPVSVLFVWRLARPASDTKVLFGVFAITLLALDFLYLARGEGERSAMHIIPFVVLPAAHLLEQFGRSVRSYGPLAATLCFLAFQCWVVESYFNTYW